MFNTLMRHFNRKKLTDERFAFLFDIPIEEEVVVFDCETTGLDTKKDEIISIGAVKVHKNRILTDEALHLYLKPKEMIDHKSITIHQIRNCDLENAISAKEAIERFLYFIGNRKLVRNNFV